MVSFKLRRFLNLFMWCVVSKNTRDWRVSIFANPSTFFFVFWTIWLVWISNGQKRLGPQIFHILNGIWNWSGFWMVGTTTIAIAKAWPFDIRSLKSPNFKGLLIFNGRISDPHCNCKSNVGTVSVYQAWLSFQVHFQGERFLLGHIEVLSQGIEDHWQSSSGNKQQHSRHQKPENMLKQACYISYFWLGSSISILSISWPLFSMTYLFTRLLTMICSFTAHSRQIRILQNKVRT